MITEKALKKARVLAFWEKHGLSATLEAFGIKRRTIFLWKKKLKEGGGNFEALNDISRAPKKRRKRLWPFAVTEEIRRLRNEHPNLGKDKIYMPLRKFCNENHLPFPRSSTIGRLLKDCGGLRMYPQKPSCAGKRKLKRENVLRKPKNLVAEYPCHVVALDTIERFVDGCRRYIITFEDIHTRFAFAWATTSHASLAAEEFFGYCRKVFPIPFTFVLTDNGSEFKKHFSKKLKCLHLTHYHTYPKTSKMNAHCERFNRTIQEEFVDYNAYYLKYPRLFNQKLMEWLIWYNTERTHWAFDNRLSPLHFMLSLKQPRE
ncbi:DDE-type integrase/transposase/recombinase, partial [Candidatus Peregrinibacteria bacterium]|nr:DDE-type integrase/transposase/recombinase [Candidatus Peregrinibacteria bacterium]